MIEINGKKVFPSLPDVNVSYKLTLPKHKVFCDIEITIGFYGNQVACMVGDDASCMSCMRSVDDVVAVQSEDAHVTDGFVSPGCATSVIR